MWVRCYMDEMEASPQAKPEDYAVQQLRNNKAPGENGIPAEVYKRCHDSLGPWLHRVITKLWLCNAVLLRLFKKRDKRICSSYRCISLINVAANVFGVVLKRFQSERDQRIRPN